MKKVLTVEGMMCAHCQARVQKALAGVDGVVEVMVDLGTKQGGRYPLQRTFRTGLWRTL